MALNALLYSWTVNGGFIPETPAAVVDVASKAGQWLTQNVLSGKYKPYSITFSGSVKAYIVSMAHSLATYMYESYTQPLSKYIVDFHNYFCTVIPSSRCMVNILSRPLSLQDLPFFYPANYARYLNGSLIPPGTNSTDSQTVVGVLGIIPEAEYNAMLKEKHFGENTPLDFHGYNAAGSGQLIFWSSEPFTYASSLLALTQYRNLLKSGQLVLRRPA